MGEGHNAAAVKGEADRPQKRCGSPHKARNRLVSQVLQEGSRVTVDWTKPVSLKCQTGEGRGAALGPGVPPGTQRLFTFPAKGDVSSERAVVIAAVHGVSVRSREARAGVGGVAQWIERLPSAGFHLSIV